MSYFDRFKAVVGSLVTSLPTVLMSMGSMITTTMTLTGAETAAAAATTLLHGALKLLMGPVGWLIGGIAALGVVFYLLDKNSPEGKLKKAREELEKSKTEAKELKDAYNDLKSSLDSLQTAQNTLNYLTKGTR